MPILLIVSTYSHSLPIYPVLVSIANHKIILLLSRTSFFSPIPDHIPEIEQSLQESSPALPTIILAVRQCFQVIFSQSSTVCSHNTTYTSSRSICTSASQPHACIWITSSFYTRNPSPALPSSCYDRKTCDPSSARLCVICLFQCKCLITVNQTLNCPALPRR